MHDNIGKIVLVVIIFAAMIYLIAPLDFRLKDETRSLATSHENPEADEQVLSTTFHLMFGDEYLNLVLQMDPEKVKAMAKNIPFFLVSPSLKEASEELTSFGISLSQLLLSIDEDLDKLSVLKEQFRLDEVAEKAKQISDNLSQADSELKRIEQAIVTINTEMEASLASEGSTLRPSYDDLTDSVDKIRHVLVTYNDLFTELLTETEKAEKLLAAADITLEVEPTLAFVGDNIYFEGRLSSEGKPLARRDVDILLNGSEGITAITDTYGHYAGTLQVPYWYIPELYLQARYYPRVEDFGPNLGRRSPVTKLEVLFYEADPRITVEDKAYPGQETIVAGRFDHGYAPSLSAREAEVYLDDTLITEFVAQGAFTQTIKIDPEADTGEHIITVSSPAAGRYAPVAASAFLNVTRATPVLDLSLPVVAIIPGSVGLDGKLYSEIGPLSEASIKMGLGKSQVELASSEDGSFDTNIKVGMGFGVIGSQDLVVQVLPQEPWHTPLYITSRIIMVNVVNGGALVAVLFFLGIYLPGRLRRRLGAYPKRAAGPAIATARPEVAPAYSERVTALTSTEEGDKAGLELRNRILYRYRLTLRLLGEITKALLKPQQTLREFAGESRRIIGPAAKPFVDLTSIVERLLYSPYRPTERDVENSRQLTGKVEEEIKLRATAQSLPARQLRGEVTGARFESGFEFDRMAYTSSPWRQLSTWLWALLLLAIIYYAGILFLVLPLLAAS